MLKSFRVNNMGENNVKKSILNNNEPISNNYPRPFYSTTERSRQQNDN